MLTLYRPKKSCCLKKNSCCYYKTMTVYVLGRFCMQYLFHTQLLEFVSIDIHTDFRALINHFTDTAP